MSSRSAILDQIRRQLGRGPLTPEAVAALEARRPAHTRIAMGDELVQAINYFVAQKYVEALKEFAVSPNQKVMFLPMEASALIGTIGGIAELAKDAMAKQGGTAPPARQS